MSGYLRHAKAVSADFFEKYHKDGAPRAVSDVVALVGGGLVANAAFVALLIVRAKVIFLLLIAL